MAFWGILIQHFIYFSFSNPTLNHYENKWTPPIAPFQKLKFDGASQGNLGRASFGVLKRSEKGDSFTFYIKNIEISTNNHAKLLVLWYGLKQAQCLCVNSLIIGSDLYTITRML